MSTEDPWHLHGAVAQHYSRWCYPPPIDDMAAAITAGYFDRGDVGQLGALIWPSGPPARQLEILVAGCGTHQAAYFALTNPESRVLGIDLSGPSLAHQSMLRDKHKLQNLELARLDLSAVPSLGRTFDYIVSTGVLHHLPDADAGLVALGQVLRPHGSIFLMLYNAHARHGVYMLQDAFRMLGFRQTEADVALVKRTLAELPA